MAIDFGRIYKQFAGEFMDICSECGGQCEKTDIAIFFPGEESYTAKQMGMKREEFLKRYCNIIKFKGHDIVILKAGFCPFLNDGSCSMEKENIKLLGCRQYPFVFVKKNNMLDVDIDYERCPGARKISEDFKRQARRVFKEIKDDVPSWWLEFYFGYSEVPYDYDKMDNLRDKEVINLKELVACRSD
jgi:uncharacterized protein